MKTRPALFVCASFIVVTMFSFPVVAQPLGPVSGGAPQAYDAYGRPNPDAFEWTGLSLGATIGTLGYGSEVTYYLFDWVNVRGSFHLFDLTYKDTFDGVDYKLDLDWTGIILTLDFYPGQQRSFRIAAGAGLNDHSAGISGGSYRGKADYDSIAPYIGIGWANPVQPDAALTFTFDMGLLLQDYSVGYSAAPPSDTQSDINDVLDLFTVYPVFSFGLHYHF
ncbi:MAG: hypothetical protein ACO3ZG_00075 [Kiritimatiellia bacterium]